MTHSLTVNQQDPTPIYIQLEHSICRAIAEGKFNVGDRLPTVRQLAVEARVNVNTVTRVYTELGKRGVLQTQRGVGTFIRGRMGDQVGEALRKKKLTNLVNRFLTEGMKEGFTADELKAALRS